MIVRSVAACIENLCFWIHKSRWQPRQSWQPHLPMSTHMPHSRLTIFSRQSLVIISDTKTSIILKYLSAYLNKDIQTNKNAARTDIKILIVPWQWADGHVVWCSTSSLLYCVGTFKTNITPDNNQVCFIVN